ncbi:MAG TPA: STAS domain-containing protein [Terriglobales bacterium]|nr:STAS domain-containing protein [Terriglobales bacterium]
MSTTPPSGFRTLSIEHATDEHGTPVLLCRGRMNLETAEQFRTEVKKLASAHKHVDANLAEVDSVDSAGLGSLLGTYISAKNSGCDLRLIKVNPRVRDLLNMTHLTQVLHVEQ